MNPEERGGGSRTEGGEGAEEGGAGEGVLYFQTCGEKSETALPKLSIMVNLGGGD